MTNDRMTPNEIHDFGIEVVSGYLEKEGYELVAGNSKLGSNPQIVARRNGDLIYVIVRTACYPQKGVIESDAIALHCIEWARSKGASCYFASVGIANAKAKDDAGMAVPTRGAGFYVAFNGLVIMTTSDRAKLLRERPSG